MSISYCCILEKTENILLCESTNFCSQWDEIKGLLTRINKGLYFNSFFIENDSRLIYRKKKSFFFIVIASVSTSDNKINKFMSKFIECVNFSFVPLDNRKLYHLCFQKETSSKLDNLISDVDSGLLMERDQFDFKYNSVKLDFNNNLQEKFNNFEEILIKSNTIIANTTPIKKVTKPRKKTSSRKSWRIYLYIFIFIMIVVYTIFSMLKCENLSILCETS